MTEPQAALPGTSTSTDIGTGWGDAIADDRKQELWSRLRAWWDEGIYDQVTGPFAKERLTGAEVFWLAVCALAKKDNTTEEVAQLRLRTTRIGSAANIDLSCLCLRDANLANVQLQGAILRGVQAQKVLLSGAQLTRTNLSLAQLQEANLKGAQLEEADLSGAQLQGATLYASRLERSSLTSAYLERANLSNAHLAKTDLSAAHLVEASLRAANMVEANLSDANMNGANLIGAHLTRATLRRTQAHRVIFRGVQAQGANFRDMRAERANFRHAQLQKVILRNAQLSGADFRDAQLSGADLREAFFDRATIFRDAIFSGAAEGNVRVADARWSEVNLAILRESLKPPLGDEQSAHHWRFQPLTVKDGQPAPSRADRLRHRQQQEVRRLELYRAAARANRQLAVTLQSQGMNEEAARFSYRAQVCQRTVFRLEGLRSQGRWFFSWLLDGLAGYGYKPGRSIGIYLVVIAVFMGIYYGLGAAVGPHLSLYEALVVSVTAFHGRGFFATTFQPGDPQAGVAALEAVIGLLIEISFIATFTQRFFGSK